MGASNQAGPAAARRVVIVGGGYAGTTCAVSLGRALRASDDVEVLVIEPDPCQQALSELDLVAVGPPRPQFCELWHPTVFRDLPVTMCYSRVKEVRSDRRAVVIETGEVVEYWRLVIATGAVPWVPDVPGLRERAITMWSVEDAQELQQAIEDSFKLAARLPDHQQRKRALSYTVVGGGATGVEMVGTLGQMLPYRMRDAGLDPDDLRITLIEGRPQILYDLPEPLRHRAVRRLERMGVIVITGDKLVSIDSEDARLESGRAVPSTVLVWCGGAQADPHAAGWGFPVDPDGRVKVDETLKVHGREDVYVIGDVAAAKHPKTGKTLPMLAQVAIQQGPAVAASVLAESRGGAAAVFAPHLRGEFVSVGPRWGVGWMYSFALTGIPAIIMKRITYVKYWFQVGGIKLAWHRTREMLAMQR